MNTEKRADTISSSIKNSMYQNIIQQNNLAFPQKYNKKSLSKKAILSKENLSLSVKKSLCSETDFIVAEN